MERTYYPDHDKRYEHIPKRERWKYPDEIQFEFESPIKRTKPLNELIWEDVPDGLFPSLVANDRPFTEGCIKV